MSLGVFLAVLAAAFLHALWNALIKQGTSKVGGMVILSIVEIPIGLTVVALSPPIALEAVPWLLASGCTHFCYKFFLCYAYDRGDLSRVYPIARGAAPMVVALVGAFVLADAVSPTQYMAIALLAAGILLMSRGIFTSGENRRLLQAERLAHIMPLEALPDPSGVADAVLYLASAQHVTGQILFVDGGAHLKSFERDFVHL